MNKFSDMIENYIVSMSINELDELLISLLIEIKEKREETVKRLYNCYSNNKNVVNAEETYFSKLHEYNDFMDMYDKVKDFYKF